MVEEAVQRRRAKAGMVMSAGTFGMAAASGLQGALYLHSHGIDGRTDGFFVAFALYTVFGVFSQSIRVSSASLLVATRQRLSVRAFAAALALIAVPVALLTVPLAHPLALLLAPGLSDGDRAVTEQALPILGGAMVLQLWAAGGATLLAVRERFNAVGGAYLGGAAAGLAAYLAVSGPAGVLSLGYSMLAMAVVTAAMIFASLRDVPLRRPAGAPRLRLAGVAADAGRILGRTTIYLAFNALYLVTLSFTTSFAPGDATVLSYSYLFASYLVAGTAFALGMSRIGEMSREGGAGEDAFADTVPQGFRYSMLICAPALAAFVAAGAAIAGVVFSASLSAADVRTLEEFGALLAPWTVAALLVNLLLPAMFAVGRARFVNLLAPALLAVHAAASALGGALFGAVGVVGAAFVAPALFAAVLLVAGAPGLARDLAREVSRDALRFAGLAAGSYGLGAMAGAALGYGLLGATLAGAVGTLAYLAALPLFAPSQVALLLRSLRPPLRARQSGARAAT